MPFYVFNEWSKKRSRDNDNDRSVYQNILISSNWDILKELYILTKPFYKYTACMKDHTITDLYKALWEILPAIELLVLEYKSFAACYTIFALSSN